MIFTETKLKGRLPHRSEQEFPMSAGFFRVAGVPENLPHMG